LFNDPSHRYVAINGKIGDFFNAIVDQFVVKPIRDQLDSYSSWRGGKREEHTANRGKYSEHEEHLVNKHGEEHRRWNFQRPDYDLFLLTPTRESMAQLVQWYDADQVTHAPVDSTYAVDSDESLWKAMAKMKSRRAVGKIIFALDAKDAAAAGATAAA
jgi:hypothetical protein